MDLSEKTIEYYNAHAEEFIANTVSLEFSDKQMKFLSYLPENALILDFGCGSGRDTKYFLGHGYRVHAVDGSREMCRKAAAYTGIYVKRQLFSQLDAQNCYDGIWASSSILHLPGQELYEVMGKMTAALKVPGVIFTSFKYGSYEGERNGRYFKYFTEDSFQEFMRDAEGLKIEELWVTADVRPDRSDEKWLNLILRKN